MKHLKSYFRKNEECTFDFLDNHLQEIFGTFTLQLIDYSFMINISSLVSAVASTHED
jgi:hypothetical protein